MNDTVPLSELPTHLAVRWNWRNGHYYGPGVVIPPRKEDCSCACSATDDLGRPLHIGLCPDAGCERRPR